MPLPLALTLRAAQGLLLDCDAATLTVWVNGERKGVMVRPGMTDEEGCSVGRLEGPLCWAADVLKMFDDFDDTGSTTSVAIDRPAPPRL